MPVIVAVLRGTPRQVGVEGHPDPMQRAFRSAIWKAAVEGPVYAGPLGLEGDDVADKRHHGGADQALLVYGAVHYGRWRMEWQDDEVGAGAFGENLCVSELVEDTVCIGDVYAAGDTVRLQVTKPRQPCATLARRHQRSDLVRTVTGNGRSGWYVRVVEPGPVEAGTPFTLLERVAPDWTVRRVQRVWNFRREHPDEYLALADVPGLAADWKAKILDGD